MHHSTIEDIKYYNTIQLVFEVIFLFEMGLGFITEYLDENNKSVKDLAKISKHYLKTGFLLDLIPLIPFNYIFAFTYSRYFFLLKSIRLI